MSLLFAGSRFESGYVDDYGEAARFDGPMCMEFDDDWLYVTEWRGCRVRRIDPRTALVSTVATFAQTSDGDPRHGSQTSGIFRHPISGKFYVCNPGPSHGFAGAIHVFNPDFSPSRTINLPFSGVGNYRAFFCTVSDDETVIYCAGDMGSVNAAFESCIFSLTGSGALITNRGVNGVSGFADPCGLRIIGGQLWYDVGRFQNRGLWVTDLALSSMGTWHDTPGDAMYQFHPLDADHILMSCAVSEYSWERGAIIYEISTDTWSDPVPGGHTETGWDHTFLHAEENDTVFAFGQYFAACSRVRQSSGFDEFEYNPVNTWSLGPPPEPHSIEILTAGRVGWSYNKTSF